MLTEEQILSALDNYKSGYYCFFIDLGEPYSYLIDCRLNVFKDDGDKWAIVAERLGYNPRGGGISLRIYYFGNCLINLERYNEQDTNSYTVTPINWNDFWETEELEVLKPDAKFWTIRGHQIELSHDKHEYRDAGIEPREGQPDEVSLEEAGRLLAIKCPDLLRATDQELYKSIPGTLKKILVLDEWYHRDFDELPLPTISDEHLKSTYEFNKNLAGDQEYMDYESFAALFRKQEGINDNFNQMQWQDNRPSTYETWQLLAKVIATGNTSLYKPTLEPNTHWRNWPESGNL